MRRTKRDKVHWPISPSAFTAGTVGAVVLVIILIVLSRVSIPRAAAIVPTPVQPSLEISPMLITPVPTLTHTSQPSPTLPIPFTPGPFVDLPTYMGSSTAPVTVIEYSDFQCAHCQTFALTVEDELAKAYVATGKVRLIYKFANLYMQSESQLANEAAACAAEQGQFWPYYFLLMSQRASPNKEDLTAEKLRALAQQLGLNMEIFNSSLNSHKFTAKVTQDDTDRIALGVTGTPTFFINGIKQDGANSLQDLADIIDPFLEKAGK